MVDDAGRLVGVVSRRRWKASRGSARLATVASVMARDDGGGGLRVGPDESLEALLLAMRDWAAWAR